MKALIIFFVSLIFGVFYVILNGAHLGEFEQFATVALAAIFFQSFLHEVWRD